MVQFIFWWTWEIEHSFLHLVTHALLIPGKLILQSSPTLLTVPIPRSLSSLVPIPTTPSLQWYPQWCSLFDGLSLVCYEHNYKLLAFWSCAYLHNGWKHTKSAIKDELQCGLSFSRRLLSWYRLRKFYHDIATTKTCVKHTWSPTGLTNDTKSLCQGDNNIIKCGIRGST